MYDETSIRNGLLELEAARQAGTIADASATTSIAAKIVVFLIVPSNRQ